MQATFTPTGYKFTFADQYFVQLRRAGAYADAKDSHPIVACFANVTDATDFARAAVKRNDITHAWVFTRDQQVLSLNGE